MRSNFLYRFYAFALFIFFFAGSSLAQDAGAASPKGSSNETLLLIIIGILLFALLVMAMILRQMSYVVREVKKGAGYIKKVSGLRRWWDMLDKKIFTRAVPVEKEADVLLDHNYDGVRELDNALPPWWKWGFYFTLIVAVFYMLRFHVWKTGPTPEQEYNKEMQIAEVRLEQYRSKNKEQVDEKTVTMADAAGIAEGKKIFTGTCVPCHGANGEGNAVGPNLTDTYWIHGGSINEVFKTVKLGVPDKGMQAWERTFSPVEIKNIVSYVLSLQGSNPPNAKAPQGNLYTPAAATDSLSVNKDSVVKKPAT